jgi:ribonuclease BN (tRNA processing enzyme)
LARQRKDGDWSAEIGPFCGLRVGDGVGHYELHTPPRKIGEAARDSGAKSLLLSHIAPDVEESKNAVRRSIRAAFAGPIAFASDRLRVPIAP